MRYRLIGIDLDGTLLDRHGRLSPANRAALAAARAAGALIAPCTGRAWGESCAILKEIPELDCGVFVGGAVVNHITSGRSLDLAILEPHLALELVNYLYDAPEAVLVFQDADLTGGDYLVTGRGTLSANTRWWFETTGARPRFKREITLEDLHHSLRVGIVSSAARMSKVSTAVRENFGDRVTMHAFASVKVDDVHLLAHVLEIFAGGVDKWRGLRWIAAQAGIADTEIAAIGDEINDVAMLQSAGCGIAMGNAIDAVKEVAGHVTQDNNHDGVAHAIQKLLEGEWG